MPISPNAFGTLRRPCDASSTGAGDLLVLVGSEVFPTDTIKPAEKFFACHRLALRGRRFHDPLDDLIGDIIPANRAVAQIRISRGQCRVLNIVTSPPSAQGRQTTERTLPPRTVTRPSWRCPPHSSQPRIAACSINDTSMSPLSMHPPDRPRPIMESQPDPRNDQPRYRLHQHRRPSWRPTHDRPLRHANRRSVRIS